MQDSIQSRKKLNLKPTTVQLQGKNKTNKNLLLYNYKEKNKNQNPTTVQLQGKNKNHKTYYSTITRKK